MSESDDFATFGTIGTVGAELTWGHIFRALGRPPEHPLHVKAMASMIGPQLACEDCWALKDDCGKHEGEINQEGSVS